MFARKSKVLFQILTTFSFLSFLMLNKVSHSTAQQAYFWSEQQEIPEYYDNTEEPPYLIADQNFTVHAFNAQPLDLSETNSQRAIFYRQWNIESGWSFPNDIFFDPNGGNMDLIGVNADQTGKVHMVFQSNNERLYYSQAFLGQANSAISWSTPVLLATDSLNVRPGLANVGAISTDNSGNNIVVVYAGIQEGNGLYFTHSADQGLSWSRPYPLYLTDNESMPVTDPKLYLGESGLFHAVWSTFESTGFGGPGFYANFDPIRNIWSIPIELDIPGIRTPSVIEYAGDVIVSYHHFNVNGNMWRQSSDGGKTWTYPSQISIRHQGTNGAVSFVVDSDNALHAFFGERIDDNNHGMWHSILIDTIWTNPEAVVRGPQVKDSIGGNGFDPRSARAIVSNGNVILVTWGTDGAAGENGAWYSYKRFPSPELPALTLPVPSVIAPAISTDSLTVPANNVDSNGTNITLENYRDSPRSPWNPQVSIFLGVVPVILVLVVVVLVHYLSRENK
jgi:hypothetical protein